MEFLQQLANLFQGMSLTDNLANSIGAVINNFVVEEPSFLETLQSLDFGSINTVFDSIAKLIGG